METPDIRRRLEPELLDPRHYAQSLIEQACRCGLLSDGELAAIRTELLAILAGQAERWSGGKSSSIPVEKAQELTASILFVLGVQLKSYQTPERAAEALCAEPLQALFESGMKRVQRKTALSRHLQKRILAELLATPNVYYRATIEDGISGFFKLYRPQFAAHEIHITADYPVLLGRPEAEGIEFIEEYLRRLQAENAFCVRFAPQDIDHLLCGLTPDHRSVPMNMFEPVLLSALGLTLRGRDPERLDLRDDDVRALYRLLGGLSADGTQERLSAALLALEEKMDLPQLSMRYAFRCIPKLVPVILNAVKQKALDKVFLVPAYPEREPHILVSYGDRMSDGEYQRLVEQLQRTDDSEEKAALILHKVHSLADLLDVLSDAELCVCELDRLIALLPLPAFSMLLAQYPDDAFLDREWERLLFAALQGRKRRLSEEEARQIERLLRALRREEL